MSLPSATYSESAGHVLGMRLSATSYQHATNTIGTWITQKKPSYVCVCSVHMVMEGYDNPRLREIVNNAGLVTTDGMPLVWYLRKHGYPQQSRVYGPLLMPALLAKAEEAGWKVGLYGGDEETMDRLLKVLAERYPNLLIAYSYSPPFRTLSDQEKTKVRSDITDSNVQLLFVGLGCPKQEFWMGEECQHLSLVMVGVGAAFPFLAGTTKQAPPMIQKSGLEWLFRLVAEPKRLWKRYSRIVPRFIFLMMFPKFQRPVS